MDILAAASLAGSGILSGYSQFSTIITMPDRDTVPPPQLTADAPIMDIFHPVVINFLKAFRNDFDIAVLDCFERLFGKGSDFHEPLG